MQNRTATPTAKLSRALAVVFIFYAAVEAQAMLNAQENYNEALRYHNQGNDVASCVWLEKAAQQGHLDAQNKTGLCYDKGYGGITDFGKALYWFRTAANAGESNGQVNLSYSYANGRGVPADFEKACYWATVASLAGNKDGMDNANLYCAKIDVSIAMDTKNRAQRFVPTGATTSQTQSYSSDSTTAPSPGAPVTLKRRWKKAD